MSFTVCHSKAWKLICIYFEYAKIRRIKKLVEEARTRRRWRRHNEITRKKFFRLLSFYSSTIENEPPSPFISLHLTPFRDKISFILFSTPRYANAFLSFILLSIVIIIAAAVVVCYAKKNEKWKKEKFMIQL